MLVKLFGLSAIATLLITMPAIAQSDLQRCASLETALERLSCFERLAADERAGKPVEVTSPLPHRSITSPNTEVSPDQARQALGAERIIEKKSKENYRAQNNDPNRPKTAKEQAGDGIEFSVMRTEKDGEQRRIFYMSDGQVWREIEPREIFYPRGSFDAIINTGKLGDFRLRQGKKGRFTRVTRLR